MSKNFVNYHVLVSHSPSCLNRDDMNMQKTAIFGGVRRVRVSSQSLKHWMRGSPQYRALLGTPSTRTRSLGILKTKLVEELAPMVPAELIDKAICFWADARSLDDFDSEGVPVAPWIAMEIKFLCEELRGSSELTALCDDFVAVTGNDAAAKKKKATAARKAEKLLRDKGRWDDLIKAAEGGIDVALSGRMATSGLMTKVSGALAVAHSITTHAAEADIDWFTAVDDLTVDAGDVGAGHLDTQEFSAGVFYRYASLDIGLLMSNLGTTDRARALDIATHVLRLLATVVPGAKQQSFAAHNLSEFAMVSRSDQPISLANAFEVPVRATKKIGGLFDPSVAALVGYWDRIHRGYGLDEQAAAFEIGDSSPPDALERKPTLAALEDWVRADSNGSS